MLYLLPVALIPPLILMVLIYKQDKIEKEPKRLVLMTLLFGALMIIPVFIAEVILDYLLQYTLSAYYGTAVYIIIENVIGVALIEEAAKFLAAFYVWEKPDFNYRFDGIVYAVAAAIGFAAIENVLYVLENGLGTGIMRAVLSVPSHCIDGIFMGVYFGEAKRCELNHDPKGASINLIKCIIIPTILHGIYDALLSFNENIYLLVFFVFVIALDIIAIIRVRTSSKQDVSF